MPKRRSLKPPLDVARLGLLFNGNAVKGKMQAPSATRFAKIREPIVLDVGGGLIPTPSIVFHFISHLLFCHANRAFEGPVLPEVVQNSERQQYDG